MSPQEFRKALKRVSRSLPNEEDVYWSVRAKAGRESGMLSAEETAERKRNREVPR